MEIHGYTEQGSIDATIEGVRMTVPDAPGNRHRQMIAEWEAEGNTIPVYGAATTLADAITAKLAALDAYRWEQEIGGIVLAGVPIRTDANSQAKVAAAYASAKLDASYAVPTWEAVPGTFVALDNATLIAMGEAVRAHVQDTFTRKKALHTAISALGTVEAVAAYDIATEWAAL